MFWIIILLAGGKLFVPAHATNTAAIGVWYDYSGSGMTDFKAYFYNDGFSSTGANGVLYVITASIGNGSPGQMAQMDLQLNPDGSACFSDQMFDDLGGTNDFINCTSVSGSESSWNTIELKITYDSGSGAYYVNWYWNGTWENSWNIGSTSQFDREMSPSLSLETADTTNSDFSSIYAAGYLLANGNDQNTYFYGGIWGANLGSYEHACSTYQTSGTYVGLGLEEATNVGTTGNYYGGYGGTQEWGVGGSLGSYSPLTDPILASDNAIANMCDALISD